MPQQWLIILIKSSFKFIYICKHLIFIGIHFWSWLKFLAAKFTSHIGLASINLTDLAMDLHLLTIYCFILGISPLVSLNLILFLNPSWLMLIQDPFLLLLLSYLIRFLNRVLENSLLKELLGLLLAAWLLLCILLIRLDYLTYLWKV